MQETHERGWYIVVEFNAPRGGTLENFAPEPGLGGPCRRNDGATGPLPELVPGGWELVDFGFDLSNRHTRAMDRVYLVRDPKRINTRFDFTVECAVYVWKDGSWVPAPDRDRDFLDDRRN